MPELHACYFCGEVGDGLARHAVVPPELEPSDDEQVTVMLCPTCQRKLSAALEPLIERARAGATEAPAPEAATPDETPPGEGARTSEEATTPAVVPENDGDANDAGAATDGDSEAAAADADTADDDSTAEGSTDGTATAGGPTSGTATEAGNVVETADAEALDDPLDVTIGDATNGQDHSEADEEAADGAEEPIGDDADDPTVDSSTVDLEPTDGKADEGADAVPAAGDVQVNPATFRKVMRLLSNREFPVDRGEFESLAASAYDLDDGAVAAMLDAAVEKDLLGERDGQLVRD